MLRLAGELADGVAPNWTTPEQVAWCREQVAEGARQAGRDPQAIRIVGYIRVCVDEDVDAARRALAAQVLEYAMARPGAPKDQGYRGHFGRMGFEQVLSELEARRAAGAKPEELADALPAELALRVGYFGPPAGAAAAFRRLARGLDVAIVRVIAARPGLAAAMEVAGSLVLVVSPLALGAGLFLLLAPLTDVFALAPALVILLNGVMALPYVMRLFGPALAEEAERHDRLCASLGMAGWDRWRLAAWPVLRRPVGLALGLAAALATGDLGIIALFGTQDSQTLPLLLYQQMASYRLDAAAVTGLLLLGLCLGLFWVFERGVGGRA